MLLLGAGHILTHVFMITHSLALNYLCVGRDRKDGWGVVLIIIKNNLIAEKIASSMLCEIVAVKLSTHRQPIIISACYRPPKNSISNLKQLTTEFQDRYFSTKIHHSG